MPFLTMNCSGYFSSILFNAQDWWRVVWNPTQVEIGHENFCFVFHDHDVFCVNFGVANGTVLPLLCYFIFEVDRTVSFYHLSERLFLVFEPGEHDCV